MTTTNTIKWAALLGAGVTLCAGTVIALAPFFSGLLADLGYANPQAQATAIALTLLCVSAAAVVAKLDKRVVTVSLALMSVALVGGRYVAVKHHAEDAQQAAYQADLAQFEAARADAEATRDREIAAGEALLMKGAERLIPRMRRTGRDMIASAKASFAERTAGLEAPAAPGPVELTKDQYIVIGGLAAMELAVALLVELLGAAFGFGLASLMTPRKRAVRKPRAAKATPVPTAAERRSQAAKKGWETRRAKAAQAATLKLVK